MRSRSSFFSAAALLLLAWGALLWVGIQYPQHPSAEETHYVPAARAILTQGVFNNAEHPPLGKIAIAAGMAVAGDRPQGWRLAPFLFSLFFLAGILKLARALHFSPEQTLVAGILVALNGVAFTLGRLAMLEMPMLAFLVWAIALWIESHSIASQRSLQIQLACAGAFFGFSSAAKWSGVLGLLLALIATAGLLLLRQWKVAFGRTSGERPNSEFYAPTLWKSLSALQVLGLISGGAFITYFFAFLPLYGSAGGWSTLTEWFSLQTQMWELQQQVTQTHPYGTEWYEWIVPTRTIWFEFTREPEGFVRAVFLLANPVVTLLGAGGAFLAARAVLKKRTFTAFWLLYFYAGLTLVFAVIPRKLSFYYYYAPALTFWSLLGAWALDQIPERYRKVATCAALLCVFGVFSYFYPLYSAQRLKEMSVPHWMWLSSWI